MKGLLKELNLCFQKLVSAYFFKALYLSNPSSLGSSMAYVNDQYAILSEY